jgi:hypothetical protein
MLLFLFVCYFYIIFLYIVIRCFKSFFFSSHFYSVIILFPVLLFHCSVFFFSPLPVNSLFTLFLVVLTYLILISVCELQKWFHCDISTHVHDVI